ncbi:MAG: Lrp/AsnC family transcriptional regulator [Sulfuricella sp.]|nr:Lrp/AsnC family transcriptional regulator [Sulfuricella sp.]
MWQTVTPDRICRAAAAWAEWMDQLDRAIINGLQGGFPICEHPYAGMAAQFGITEQTLIARIDSLLQRKILSRFGPMYHAERLGGSLSLAAMKLPEEDFGRVAEIVNAMPEIAHNYARDHQFNMWFVLATETPQAHADALKKIEQDTGYAVYDMPKIKEYFVGLHFKA